MYVFYDLATTDVVNVAGASVEVSGFVAPNGQGAVFVNDSSYASTFTEPWNLYQYVGGSFSLNPNASSLQLSEEKTLRLAYLTQSFEQAIAVGFPSSADGTARTYAIDPTAMQKWTGILSLINAGSGPTSITLKAMDGTKTTMTQTQFKQMATDGFTYFNTQEQNLWTKEDDVNAATTVAHVQAVTW